MTESDAQRILRAWVQLEEALKGALPVCSVQPPTQPLELLSALRINGQIGPEEEAAVLSLREIRNRVAHEPQEPSKRDVAVFVDEVERLIEFLQSGSPAC